MAVATNDNKAGASKHDAFIQTQLAKARQRIRVVDLTTAFLVFLAGTLLYTLLIVLLDRRFFLGSASRQVVLLFFLAASGAFLVRFVVLPLTRRVNPYYAARLLEQSLPNGKNRVVNWIDLHDEPLPGAIRGAIGQRAAKDLSKTDPERAISNRRAFIAGGAVAALVVALIATVLALGFRPFSSLLGRAFTPFGSNAVIATRTQIKLLCPEYGDAVITIGTPVTVLAEITGYVPDPHKENAACVLYRFSKDEAFRKRPLQPDEFNLQWSAFFRGDEAGDGLYYKVAAGDAETPEYRVRVRAAPLIAEFVATYSFRPYVGKADRSQAGRELKEVRGTTVKIEARTNRHVKNGRLEFDGLDGKGQTVPAVVNPQDPQALHFTFVLDRPGRYRLRFTSVENEHYLDPTPSEVIVLPDSAPRVKITEPAKDVELPADGQLEIKGEAADDYGLGGLTLRLQLKGGEMLAAKPYLADKLGKPGYGTPRELAYQSLLELASLKTEKGEAIELSPGREVEYWLEASDACDFPAANTTASEPRYKIKIAAAKNNPDKAKKDQEARDRQKEHEAKQDEKLKEEKKKREEERQREEKQEQAEKEQRERERDKKNKEGDNKEDQKKEENKQKGEGKNPEEKQDDEVRKKAEELKRELDKNNKAGQEKGPNKEEKDKDGEGKNEGDKEKQPGEGRGKEEERPGEGKGKGKDKGDKKGEENAGKGKKDEGKGDRGGEKKDGGGKEGQDKAGEGRPADGKDGEKGKAEGKEGAKPGDVGGQSKPGEGKSGKSSPKPGEGKKAGPADKADGGERKPGDPNGAEKAKEGEGRPKGDKGNEKPAEGKDGLKPTQAGEGKEGAQLDKMDAKNGKPGECKECKNPNGKGEGQPGKGKGQGEAKGENPGGEPKGGGKPAPRDAKPDDVKRSAKDLENGTPGEKAEAERDLRQVASKAADPQAREDAKKALEKAGKALEKDDVPMGKEGDGAGKNGQPKNKDGKEGDGPGKSAKKGEDKKDKGKEGEPNGPENQGDGPGVGDNKGKRGNGDSGQDSPVRKSDRPEKHRASAMQLDEFKKKITPEMLKDLKMSKEEYERFLRDYEDLSKKAPMPKEDDKDLAVKPGGGTSNLPSLGGKTIKGGQGKAEDLRNEGRPKPPPGYRDSYEEFLRLLRQGGK